MPMPRWWLWYHDLRAAFSRRPVMTPDRFVRARQLFGAALALPPDERPAYLRVACGDDPAMLAEVEGLLSSHNQAGSFLQHSGANEAATISMVIEDYSGR